MVDTYKNFSELSRERQEGTDFKIKAEDSLDKSIAFVAPHGGKIECRTSEVAIQSANGVFCLYLFEGVMVKNNYKLLHITSHNFDEPKALELVSKCGAVVGVHGRRDKGDKGTIYLGGLDVKLIKLIETELKNCDFKTKCSGHEFPAKNKYNICNRGISGKGAQIELPVSLRKRLSNDSFAMGSLSGALHRAACEFKRLNDIL